MRLHARLGAGLTPPLSLLLCKLSRVESSYYSAVLTFSPGHMSEWVWLNLVHCPVQH